MVGNFKIALTLLDCRGERTLFMAEQLALNQFGRDCRTIHLHKWVAGPVAHLMQPMRHRLLAGTVLTRDEHPRIRWGHLPDNRLQLLHRR